MMIIIAGIVTILIASWVPSPFAIGIFWPISLALILSFIVGAVRNGNVLFYILGTIIGGILWVAINFHSWAQMSVMLLFFQCFINLSAILGVGLGYVIRPIKE